ncbi:MAG TPA: hypothetical protein VKK79_10065 [Candidatus Lokiarchaeia archaeon]|nr:hypothetical protein [Candidatus Lokiarchaeia archaeon]
MAMILPKYIIKRIFPTDAVSNVDMDEDGEPDHIQFKAFNIMMPISVSEINSWNLRLETAGKMHIDGQELDPTLFIGYYDGRKFSIENFYDSTDLVIPVGGRAKIFYPWPGGLAIGNHELKVSYSWQEFSGEVVVEREITPELFCVPFSPDFD